MVTCQSCGQQYNLDDPCMTCHHNNGICPNQSMCRLAKFKFWWRPAFSCSVNQGSHRCPEDRRDPGVVLTRAVETVVGRHDVSET
jgi:hypothetical protein